MPIRIISGAANDIARGNFDIAIPIKTSDEIGMLCESFNSMSRDIKSRTTELIESEAHLTEAQRIAHIGNCAWDIGKNKLYGSDEAYRIFGLTQQKFDDTYETFLNCVHPEDREFVNKSLDDALNNKKPIDIEHRILLKDTTVRIVQKKCVPILNDAGKVIRMVGTVQDITERKRAEEELITEKNKFLAVINAMEDGLTIQDLDYNIIYQNETIKNIFGVRLGEKCYSTYEGKNSICDGCPVEMVYKDGKSHISERRVVLPSGEIVFYENIASPIIDASGKIVSCLAIARNITGRKQAEAEMHLLQTIIMEISASKDLHEALIVTIRKVCDVTGWVYGEAWKLNPDGTLLERNHAYYSSIEGFEKFSAFAEGMTFPLGIGLPGRAWSKKQPVWIPDVTLDPQYLRIPIAREVGLKAGIAFPIIADNEVIAVAVFYKLEAEERDERLIKLASAVMSQLGSVIKRKQAEEEKERLREQLYHVQKIESVGTLAGGIAHDFNNILTVIIGFGSLLQTEIKENVTAIDFVQKIMKSAERAANLTRGLLIFSRKQPTNPEPVNLNDAVRNVESVLGRVIREDIEFKTLLTDKNCIVMADINQIEQVLMNLATNARDAMPNGGSLTISTDIMEMDDAFIKAHGYGAKGIYALISVSDTGIGMDEITKQKIFEPFFTTKEVGKGTGLGLAIVYGIVKQHNGYINVYSEPGKGTTFRIYLPLIKSLSVNN